ISGDDGANFQPRLFLRGLSHQLGDLRQAFVVPVYPGRRMRDEDDLVVGLGFLGRRREIDALGFVDAVGEARVEAPYPPVVGKVEREVAPPLLAAPSSDLQAAGRVAAGGTEYAGEGGKAVVPVMVSGNEEQL